MALILLTAKHIDKSGCGGLDVPTNPGRWDVVGYSHEAARRIWRSYEGVTFKEMFVKLDGVYFDRDDTESCEGCGAVFHARCGFNLDDDGYCVDNGCSDEHEADMDAEDRHVRLERMELY